jgi:hypothetical protein
MLRPIVLRCSAMNGFKLLIDTNVVIGLEDAQPVQASFAELVRLSGEHGVRKRTTSVKAALIGGIRVSNFAQTAAGNGRRLRS